MLRIYFSENAPGIFWICYFTLRNSRENKLSSQEILQSYVTPIRNFKVKTKIHGIFLYTPGNSTPFFN